MFDMAAILILFIVLVMIAIVFWNWEFIQNFLPDEMGFQFDFETQMFMILLITTILLFLVFLGRRKR